MQFAIGWKTGCCQGRLCLGGRHLLAPLRRRREARWQVELLEVEAKLAAAMEPSPLIAFPVIFTMWLGTPGFAQPYFFTSDGGGPVSSWETAQTAFEGSERF